MNCSFSFTIQVAFLLNLFKIPLISYASTSIMLNDKSRFEYFARTVPPDSLKALAMVDIIKFFDWSYISVVASGGDYDDKGREAFRSALSERNICIATEVTLHWRENYEEIVERLKNSNTRVVALFLGPEDATQLLLAAQRLELTDYFVWITFDSWKNKPMPLKDLINVTRGALTLELKSGTIPGFGDYFKHKRPASNFRNPWFNEFWELEHQCRFEPNEHDSLCTGNEKSPSFKQDDKLQYICDAVYIVAQALDKVLKEKCWSTGNKKECLQKYLREEKTFYNKYLLNTSFRSKLFLFVLISSSNEILSIFYFPKMIKFNKTKI